MAFSEEAMTRLLERAPVVEVPADFAARVRGALPPAMPPRPVRSTARTVAILFAVLIAGALFALAPHTPANVGNVAFWMEMLLLCELGGIAYWLSVQRAASE